jgi:hypothetical protein
MTGYYDYVLGLIPATLFGITATLTLSGVALTTAVPVASSVAASLVAHALFVNGPGGVSKEEVPDASASPTTGPAGAD